MKWIESTGGPCILIANEDLKNWSGIGKIEDAKNSIFKEAEDFLDPKESHYGMACEVEEEINIVNLSISQTAIVIADEPAQMTIIQDSNTIMIVKWFCGESKEKFESFLNISSLKNQENWENNLTVELIKNKYNLIDSSEPGFDFEKENSIELDITKGIYSVDTLFYSPDNKTSMNLHRFKLKTPYNT